MRSGDDSGRVMFILGRATVLKRQERIRTFFNSARPWCPLSLIFTSGYNQAARCINVVPKQEDDVMRIAKEDIPVQIDVPGATARQQTDFGDVTGYGKMGAEYFSFGAGTDITELLHGLENDRCQSPHWGYVVEGAITALYTDGSQETSRTGDLFYWPPGHSVRAEKDTDIVMFSPQEEHGAVIKHIRHKVNG